MLLISKSHVANVVARTAKISRALGITPDRRALEAYLRGHSPGTKVLCLGTTLIVAYSRPSSCLVCVPWSQSSDPTKQAVVPHLLARDSTAQSCVQNLILKYELSCIH